MPEQAPRKNAPGRKTSNFKLDSHGSERRDSVGIAGQALLQSLIDSGLAKDADSLHLYISGGDEKGISCYFHHSGGLVKSEKKFSPTILLELVEYLKKAANLKMHILANVQSAQFSIPSFQDLQFRLSSIKNADLNSEHLVLHFKGKRLEPAELSSLGLSTENLTRFQQIIKKRQGIVIVSSKDIFSAHSFVNSVFKEILSEQSSKKPTILAFDSTSISAPKLSQSYESIFSPIDSQNISLAKNALMSHPDIVVFMDPTNSLSVDLALQQALLNKLVFIVTNQASVGEALKSILSLSSDPKVTLQNVCTVLSLTTIKSIKRSTANHDLNDNLLDQLETFFGVDGQSGWADLFGHAKLTLSEPILPVASEYGPLTNLIELLYLDEELKTALYKNISAQSDVITWLAIRSGMLTRRHDGLVRALHGELDVADVVSVTS